MNIIAERQERRKNHILMIVHTLKQAFSAGVSVDKEKLINEISSKLGTSRRTSLEYLTIALVSVDCVEEVIDGRKSFVCKSEGIQ